MKKQDNRQKIVIFVDENTKDSFERLKNGKFEQKQLYDFINRAMDYLKKNPQAGIHVPERNWPKEYIQKYNINNLWKYDLPKNWRLIYTIKGTEVEILAVILEWFSHKEYDRKFGYKTS
ncbi:type II toxin-antitoxin system RelE/ParE family toxin [archaeon]|nr:type II toxin-antitoxin system RelE/ParE family toxin [archaeon]